MKNNQISVNADTIEDVILAINELSSAIYATAYTGKAKFILGNDPDQAGQRAIDFVTEYADLTGAALRMISCTTEMISDAIVNDELKISLVEAD